MFHLKLTSLAYTLSVRFIAGSVAVKNMNLELFSFVTLYRVLLCRIVAFMLFVKLSTERLSVRVMPCPVTDRGSFLACLPLYHVKLTEAIFNPPIELKVILSGTL